MPAIKSKNSINSLCEYSGSIWNGDIWRGQRSYHDFFGPSNFFPMSEPVGHQKLTELRVTGRTPQLNGEDSL